MNPTLRAVLGAATSSLLAAQQLPEITSCDNPSLPLSSLIWQQELQNPFDAAMRWGADADESTLLMVHTTIDKTVAGQIAYDGIVAALPFLISPADAGWTLNDPAFTAMTDYVFEGEAPQIPPDRVAAFLSAFAASGHGPGFGTYSGALPTTHYATASMVTWPGDPADERAPWALTNWSIWPTWAGLPSFDCGLLGRESVTQMAYNYVQSMPWLPPLDDAALALLNDLMDQKLGFEIYVQPIGVKLPAPEELDPKIRIKFKRFTRIRRVSLYGLDPWAAMFGADRWIPLLTNASKRIYLAPLSDQMHLEFDRPVSSLNHPTPLRAWVPTATGYRIVPQTPNPVFAGKVLAPEKAIFAVPPDAVSGSVLVEDLNHPGVAVKPIGAIGSGARIITYQTTGN